MGDWLTPASLTLNADNAVEGCPTVVMAEVFKGQRGTGGYIPPANNLTPNSTKSCC